jgi:hypothetical protein
MPHRLATARPARVRPRDRPWHRSGSSRDGGAVRAHRCRSGRRRGGAAGSPAHGAGDRRPGARDGARPASARGAPASSSLGHGSSHGVAPAGGPRPAASHAAVCRDAGRGLTPRRPPGAVAGERGGHLSPGPRVPRRPHPDPPRCGPPRHRPVSRVGPSAARWRHGVVLAVCGGHRSVTGGHRPRQASTAAGRRSASVAPSAPRGRGHGRWPRAGAKRGTSSAARWRATEPGPGDSGGSAAP